MDDLKNKLKKHSKNKLIKIIEQIYRQGSDSIRSQIEMQAASHKTDALTGQIEQTIEQWENMSGFIHYSECYSFSLEIASLIDLLENKLLPKNPEKTLELTEQLMEAGENIINSSDDSGGSIFMEMRRVPLVWLKAAKKLPKPADKWFAQIIKIALDNEYGIKDDFLSHIDILLSETEIKELVHEFYKMTGKYTKIERENLDYKFLQLTIGISSLAIALQDPELYKESHLMRRDELNELKTIDIVEKYLEFGYPQKAIDLIHEINWEPRFKYDKLSALEKCYEKLNDTEKLIEIKKTIYNYSPNKDTYEEVLNVLPDEEKESFRKQAIDDALKMDDVSDAVYLLFTLGKPDLAEQILIEKNEKLNSYYGSSLELAKLFEKENMIIPQIIIYRSLLLDILDRGYTKAYKYAVSYYHKLSYLSNQINTLPSNLKSCKEFHKFLKEKHGLKRSFWSKV